MTFGEKDAVDRVNDQMHKSMSDLLRAANQSPPPKLVVAAGTSAHDGDRHHVQQRRSSIWNAAAWLRSLSYEDMMQSATEMNIIRSEDVLDSPEKIAKFLHDWARSVTDAEI